MTEDTGPLWERIAELEAERDRLRHWVRHLRAALDAVGPVDPQHKHPEFTWPRGVYAIEVDCRIDGREVRKRYEAPTLEEAVRLMHVAESPVACLNPAAPPPTDEPHVRGPGGVR